MARLMESVLLSPVSSDTRCRARDARRIRFTVTRSSGLPPVGFPGPSSTGVLDAAFFLARVFVSAARGVSAVGGAAAAKTVAALVEGAAAVNRAGVVNRVAAAANRVAMSGAKSVNRAAAAASGAGSAAVNRRPGPTSAMAIRTAADAANTARGTGMTVMTGMTLLSVPRWSALSHRRRGGDDGRDRGSWQGRRPGWRPARVAPRSREPRIVWEGTVSAPTSAGPPTFLVLAHNSMLHVDQCQSDISRTA